MPGPSDSDDEFNISASEVRKLQKISQALNSSLSEFEINYQP